MFSVVLGDPSPNIIVFDESHFILKTMTKKFVVQARAVPYLLHFKFEAGTSRGVLTAKESFLVECSSPDFPGFKGYGEAGPLPGLSIDDVPDFGVQFAVLLQSLDGVRFSTDTDDLLLQLKAIVPDRFPSMRFALETALLDLVHGGKRKILPNEFYEKRRSIPINGLVWMNDFKHMWQQIETKIADEYRCIKIKIGAIDFSQECDLLGMIREKFPASEISIRVDANGAFTAEEALGKLMRLSAYDIHSIEQPIKAGNVAEMARICAESPVPVALDEELIGIYSVEEKIALLTSIRPQYIILKPTLLGGIQASKEWIQLAEGLGIGWWITSALEGNIGLNSIAQFTSTYLPKMPQGLGTGQLYQNNIASPLYISDGHLIYGPSDGWEDIGSLFS